MAYKITSYSLQKIRPEVRDECFKKLCSLVGETYNSKEALLKELKGILHITEFGLRSELLIELFRERPTKSDVFYVTTPFIIVILIFVSALIFFNIHGSEDEIGDSFGTINTLFSGLAFAGLVITLILQRNEIIQNKENINVTRNEIKKQNFEGTFFQLLGIHQDIVNSIDLYNKKLKHNTIGRDCFKTFYSRFVQIYKYKTGEVVDPDDIRIVSKEQVVVNKQDIKFIELAYDEFYKDNQAEVGHYFRNIYNIVKFVHQSEISDKQLYINLLRAQLSAYELLLLFYNCLSSLGKVKFKPLVEEYALLKTVPHQLLIAPNVHESFYKKSAFQKE